MWDIGREKDKIWEAYMSWREIEKEKNHAGEREREVIENDWS